VYDDDLDADNIEKKSVLSKYDEEIDGEKEDSFALGKYLPFHINNNHFGSQT